MSPPVRDARSISATTGLLDNRRTTPAAIAGPFTNAVLYTSLGDLIRDIDPSELGLFNLVAPSGPGANRSNERDVRGAAAPEITRVEFPGATPLRQPVRRDDAQKPKEPEPEVYAQAALKYLDRYEPIRPMPRAHALVTSIIEQVAAVRDSIQNLTIMLEDITITDSQTSPKDRAIEEESRIQEMKSRIAELQKRKEAMMKQQGRSGTKPSRSNRAAIKQKPESGPLSPLSPPGQDVQEESFWNNPGETGRTLRYDNLLTDELADLGDVSMSFSSPMPARTAVNPPAAPSQAIHPSPSAIVEWTHVPEEEYSLSMEHDTQEIEEDDIIEDEGDDDKTVVLKVKPAPATPESSISLEPVTPLTVTRSPGTEPTAQPETPSGPKRLKVRLNNEVERIVSKIWSTVGEIIMPKNNFASSGPGGPPRAKESIALLQSLASQTPSLMSPSISSQSTLSAPPRGPTSQQILTAHLLLVLLSASPTYSLPLSKVKEELASKAGGTAAALGVGSTRAVYGCVAKRLIKIERGGGEQVVKFDI